MEILATDNFAEPGYFVKVDLCYLYEIQDRKKIFTFCPENKKGNCNDFIIYLNSIKPKNFRPHDKPLCDWSDENHFLLQYRQLKDLVGMGKKFKRQIQFLVSIKNLGWPHTMP